MEKANEEALEIEAAVEDEVVGPVGWRHLGLRIREVCFGHGGLGSCI